MQDGLIVLAVLAVVGFWACSLMSLAVAVNWRKYYSKLKSASWTETTDGRLVPLSEIRSAIEENSLHEALFWQVNWVSPLQQVSRSLASIPLFFKIRQLKKAQRRLYSNDQIEFLENLRLGLIDPPNLSDELARRFPTN